MSAKIYIGRIADKVRERDLDELFGKYGKLGRVDLKAGFGFIEYQDKRDAEDAIKALDGHDFMGSRLYVDMAFTQGEVPKRRNPVPGEGRCHRCGTEGHWARECPDRDKEDDRDRSPRRRTSVGDRSYRYQPYHRRDRESPSRGRRHSSRSPSPRYSTRGGGAGSPKRSPSPRRGGAGSPYSRRSPRRAASPRRGGAGSPSPRRAASPRRGGAGSPSPRRAASPRRGAGSPSPIRGRDRDSGRGNDRGRDPPPSSTRHRSPPPSRDLP